MSNGLIGDLVHAQQIHLVNQVMDLDRIARRFGLSLLESQTLHLLALHPEIRTSSAIVRAGGLPTSTVADIVDRLERLGFLRRERNRTDRRVVDLILTERVGELGSSHADSATSHAFGKLTTEFSASELDVVLRYFSRLNALHDP